MRRGAFSQATRGILDMEGVSLAPPASAPLGCGFLPWPTSLPLAREPSPGSARRAPGLPPLLPPFLLPTAPGPWRGHQRGAGCCQGGGQVQACPEAPLLKDSAQEEAGAPASPTTPSYLLSWESRSLIFPCYRGISAPALLVSQARGVCGCPGCRREAAPPQGGPHLGPILARGKAVRGFSGAG